MADNWGSLGLGRRGVVPPRYDTEALAGRVQGALGLDQDSLAARMQRLSQLQRQRFEAGGGPGPPGSEQADLGLDIAGNLTDLAGIIRAYHGSPHTFNRYDLGKMGTGEGAQVYGWGGYFAENPKIGETYQHNLSKVTLDDTPVMDIASQKWDIDNKTPTIEQDIADYVSSYNGIKNARYTIANRKPELLETFDDMVKSGRLKETGNLYTTDLDVNPEDLLDWDAPLSKQPEKVRKSLESLGVKLPKLGEWEPFERMPGSERILDDQGVVQGMVYPVDTSKVQIAGRKYPGSVWKAVGPNGETSTGSIDEVKKFVMNNMDTPGSTIYRKLSSDQEQASKMLRDAGVPGLRFLDATSRREGEGTRNIVMFRDDLIKLLERNGMPIPPDVPMK